MKKVNNAVPSFEHISGLVERITYHNGENGFCVLRLKIKDEHDLVTMVGYTPSVMLGEYASASGNWLIDREYGRQFKATFLKISPPTTIMGIERYLGSGMVKGIGPIYAARLIKAFGANVFDVIENEPARLREIEGIGAKRARKITSRWADQKTIRKIMLFLHAHGVSTSRSMRIFKTYGQDAIEIIRANPYRLARDVRGIGFLSADTIAQKIGIPQDSPLRARAGVSYALSEASSQGHCGLPHSELVNLTVKLLSIVPALIEEGIRDEVNRKNLVADVVNGTACVFLPSLYHAEKSIATQIARLRQGLPVWSNVDVDKAIPWVERRLDIRLADSQKQAVMLALIAKLLVITGGPGVGKTMLINTIMTILSTKRIRAMLCAPTGRAAKRLSESTGLEAKTIHRLLEINPATGQFKRNENAPLFCDLLVVDECSMIDMPLANQLLKAIATRTSIIFVGDVDQLPSVGPGAFLADLIASKSVPVIQLTEIFRQAATSRIVQGAHNINQGNFPIFPSKGELSDFYFIPTEDVDTITNTVVDLVKRRLPQKFNLDAIHDIQVLCPMNRGITGARGINQMLQTALNPPGDDSIEKYGHTFSVRDKVMQIENNYDRDVYNGDIGYVVALDREDEVLQVNFDGRCVSYSLGELDELVLCYATTIHKSQGSEYPVVIIPLSTQHYMMLHRNLIYTGVTRGKRLVVLVGQKRALAMAIRDKRSKQRYSKLRERLAELCR